MATSVEEQLRAVSGYTKRLDQLCERVAGLESKVEQELKRLRELGALRRSFLVPIETLDPLGGHLKSGQWWTGQIRPTELVRD
jgi:hypothetical protein